MAATIGRDHKLELLEIRDDSMWVRWTGNTTGSWTWDYTRGC